MARNRWGLLLTPMILAAVGCATEDEATSFLPPPPIVGPVVQEMPVVPSEPRELVPGKPKKASSGRTVKPTTVNAVTVFQYVEDKVYPIATSPGYFTAVLLEPGEAMPGKAAIGDPDPTRWRIDKTTYGTPKGPVVALLIKPGDVGLKTNVFIATAKRAYQLVVTSYAKPAMDQVRWRFPEPLEPEPPQQIAAAHQAALDPLAFYFDYRITVTDGDKPRWMPLRAFDLGTKRFIQFPANLGSQISAPALFVVDGNGNSIPANFRPVGSLYEIDARFDVAELRLGGSTVRIVRAG